MIHLASTLGTIAAIVIALGALLTTPRRATVARLREEVEILRGCIETLTEQLVLTKRELRHARRRRTGTPR